MKYPATLLMALILVTFWFLVALEDQRDMLSMSVDFKIENSVILEHIRPWIYLSSGFCERHILELVPAVVATIVLGVHVEPSLGSIGLIRLILFVNVVGTFCLFINMFLLYIFVRDPKILNCSLSSFSGALMAMILSLVQSDPDREISCVAKIPFRLVPIFLNLVCSLSIFTALHVLKSDFLFLIMVSNAAYSWMGFYFGWFYLRFLHRFSEEIVGDVSEEFSFPHMFPDFCRHLLIPISSFSFNVVKLCGFFKSRTSKDMKLPLVTDATDPVIQRRKARALKSLDERIAKLSQKPQDSEEVECSQ